MLLPLLSAEDLMKIPQVIQVNDESKLRLALSNTKSKKIIGECWFNPQSNSQLEKLVFVNSLQQVNK